MVRVVLILIVSLLCSVQASPRTRTLAQRLAARRDLVDAGATAPLLRVELRYSTKNNFMKKNVYGGLRRCYLAPLAAKKLARATRLLEQARPGLRLLAYDCVRPVRVQRAMWKLVEGTPAQPYVADPARGSMHNLGCAVDLTIADPKGEPLPMGTPFDHAGPLAQPRLERKHLLEGKLTLQQLSNRLLLRYVMVQAGFFPLDIEWWHFDCMRPAEARKRLKPIP
jgi:D-alanyl-D-alanine dipeptidase